MTDKNSKPSIFSQIVEKGVKSYFEREKENAKDILADTGFRGKVVEGGAGIVSNEIQIAVDHVKANTAEIIEEKARNVSPEAKDSWEVIRSQIAPNGGFFQTIFARLAWIGAKVGAFAAAIFVDSWTGRTEREQNTPNIEIILSEFMFNLFGKKKRTQEERQSQDRQWMPQTWRTTPVTAN